MEAQAQPIKSIFNNSKVFKIPYFQRQYVWKEENWERFWNDLSALAAHPHIYFLGSLIVKEDDLEGTLIDGQQRSTTLFLLLKALYLRAGKNNEFTTQFFQNGELNDGPILCHNKHDRLIFEEIMQLGGFAQQYNSSGNVLDAWKYLSDKVCQHSMAEARDLLKVIEKYVRFVYIELDDKDDEQQIFDTINSLGVDLTTGELLKNYFFDKDNESVYTTLWAPVFERANSDYWSDSLVKGRIKESNIEQFFYALLQIAMCNPQYNIDTQTKKTYRLKDQVFSSYKHLFRNQGIERNKDPFIAMTVEYGKLYQSSFNKKVLDQAIKPDPDVKRLSLIMYARNLVSPIPYILYILRKQPDVNEQQQIFGYLEAYLVRRIICGYSTSNYADLFSENLIGQDIHTYQDLKDYIEGKDSDASLAMPSDQDIQTRIQTQNLSASAQLLLYLLEAMTQGNNITLNGLSSYIAEQLLPTKPDTSWPLLAGEAPEDRKSKAQTLGNFVLIAAIDKLKGGQRKGWQVESAALQTASQQFDATLHPVKQPNWTHVEIDAQNQQLASLICQYWPLSGVQAVVAPTQPVQAVPVVTPVEEPEEVTLDDVKSLLDFNDVDFTITDMVYHTLSPVSFDEFFQKGIDAGGNTEEVATALNQKYSEQYTGISAITNADLVAELNQDAVEELETSYPLKYIGKCTKGWVVTLDRKHFLRRESTVSLDTIIAEAKAYTVEKIDGLWSLLKNDTQLKGVLTAIKEQEAVGLNDYHYKKAIDSTITFISVIDGVTFHNHPSCATNFDQLRNSFMQVFERRSQSPYLQNYPCIVRMIYDVINYIEDYYLEHGDIKLGFQIVRHVSRARITYLDSGEAPVEVPYPTAIRTLATKYPNDLRSLTIDGVTPFMQNTPMNPGPRYEQLANGWYVFKVDTHKARGFLVIIANKLSNKVKVELLKKK